MPKHRFVTWAILSWFAGMTLLIGIGGEYLGAYLQFLTQAQEIVYRFTYEHPRVAPSLAFAIFVIIACGVVGLALYRIVNEEKKE
jgi:hypothetical protein